MSKAPGFTVFIDAFLADTTHLTLLESGAYLHLLFAMWRRNGYVPNDDADLARITKAGKKWKRIKARLAPLLTFTDDGMISQKRLLKEWLYVTTLKQKQSQNAKARWNKTNDLGDATAYAKPMPPSPSPSPTTTSTKSEKKITSTENAIVAEFHSVFWPMFRNKTGKPRALRAWHAARKRAELNDIMGGLKVYIETKPADRPWLNPATFLNEDRWADEPAPILPKRNRSEQLRDKLMKEAFDGEGEHSRRYNGGELTDGLIPISAPRPRDFSETADHVVRGKAEDAD